MLTSLTNYIFGGNQTNAATEKEDVNFQEIQEGDWTVIDTLGM